VQQRAAADEGSRGVVDAAEGPAQAELPGAEALVVVVGEAGGAEVDVDQRQAGLDPREA